MAAPAAGPRALPAAPLAVVYRTPEQASERAELLARLLGRERPRRGVLRLDELRQRGNPALLARLARSAGELALLHPATGRVEAIEVAPPGARPLAWSPDRHRLLVVARRGGLAQLFEIDLERRELRPLTHGPEAHPMGCYVGDGRLAVVEERVTPRGQESRILVGEGGGRRMRIRTEGPHDLDPACSPRRPEFVFVRRAEDGSATLMRTDLDGASPPVALARGINPAFTPDGEWVLFSASTRRGLRLRRVHRSGAPRAVVLGPTSFEEADERDPAVSPDGRFVAYVRVAGEAAELRVRSLDGRGDRPLVHEGEAVAPVW